MKIISEPNSVILLHDVISYQARSRDQLILKLVNIWKLVVRATTHPPPLLKSFRFPSNIRLNVLKGRCGLFGGEVNILPLTRIKPRFLGPFAFNYRGRRKEDDYKIETNSKT